MGEGHDDSPYQLTGGLVDLIDQAEADRLPPDELQAILATARRGDAKAAERLDRALRYLVFEVGNDSTFGHRYGAFGDALKRLLANDEAAPVKYVKTALWRSGFDRRREDAADILPDKSTNCKRRRQGKAEHPALEKQPVVTKLDGDLVDSVLHDPPGKRSESVGVSMFDLVEDLAGNEFQADVMQLLSQGYSQLQIAATLGSTKYAVAEAIKQIRRRAEALGYDE